jgi:hypothetical protein
MPARTANNNNVDDEDESLTSALEVSGKLAVIHCSV